MPKNNPARQLPPTSQPPAAPRPPQQFQPLPPPPPPIQEPPHNFHGNVGFDGVGRSPGEAIRTGNVYTSGTYQFSRDTSASFWASQQMGSQSKPTWGISFDHKF